MESRTLGRSYYTIQFDGEHRNVGIDAIVGAGVTVWTRQLGRYIVPAATVKLLRRKRIPFRIVEG